ncbi:MAG: hypothetical protein HYV33_02965 [Candidatus Kerfeldbacteria bacterium]|nr:hypothetical protein [Candidatus Kerfeldbacteria bacterium]
MPNTLLGGLLLLTVLCTGCGVIDQYNTGLQKYQEAKQTFENINQTISQQTDHHTVIVPGYGAPVAGNPTYQQYIDQVAEFVSEADNAVHSVVFTGSYTTQPDLSEAEAMNSYFNSVVDTTDLQQRGVHVYQESCAIVSWQNIAYSQELLANEGIKPTRVTIFGDQQRADKLTTFATYKFNLSDGLPGNLQDLVNVSVNVAAVEFVGFNFGDKVMSAEQRNAYFLAEIAGAYDVNVGNDILAERIQLWSDQFHYDVAANLVEHGCNQYKGF